MVVSIRDGNSDKIYLRASNLLAEEMIFQRFSAIQYVNDAYSLLDSEIAPIVACISWNR
jgi:hypothetical protein